MNNWFLGASFNKLYKSQQKYLEKNFFCFFVIVQILLLEEFIENITVVNKDHRYFHKRNESSVYMLKCFINWLVGAINALYRYSYILVE